MVRHRMCSSYKFVNHLVHMLHQIKEPQFYTDLGLLIKTVLIPLVNG